MEDNIHGDAVDGSYLTVGGSSGCSSRDLDFQGKFSRFFSPLIGNPVSS